MKMYIIQGGIYTATLQLWMALYPLEVIIAK